MEFPIFNTRDVLLDQIRIKIRFIHPPQYEEIASEITRDLSNDRILQLLCNDDLLNTEVDSVLSRLNGVDKDKLGTELFYRISKFEPELCSQLTGMLLELPINNIQDFLKNESSLKEAINKAKKEYVLFIQDKTSISKDYEAGEIRSLNYSIQKMQDDITNLANEVCTKMKNLNNLKLTTEDRNIIGEFVYNHIVGSNIEEAGKLTGMILQMNDEMLVKTVMDTKILDEKIGIALNTLQELS